MRVYTSKGRGVALLSILVFHTAVTTPVVRRDVMAALGQEEEQAALEQVALLEDEVFGRSAVYDDGEDEAARVKRFLKLTTLSGVVGGGLKTAAIGSAKAVGKAGLKAATSIGIKLAKAAVTIGIAKLLLTLVFGKINQVIDLKTRLLNGGHGSGGQGLLSISSLSTGSSSGSNSGSSHPDDVASTGTVAITDTPTGEEADPVIDPEKVALDVPNAVITNGFNVVTRAAPIIGNVIQNSAERLARLVESLKPFLSSSLGVGVVIKRDADSDTSEGDTAIAEESS